MRQWKDTLADAVSEASLVTLDTARNVPVTSHTRVKKKLRAFGGRRVDRRHPEGYGKDSRQTGRCRT